MQKLGQMQCLETMSVFFEGGRVINSILWKNVTLQSSAEMNGLIASTSFSVKCKAVLDDTTIADNEKVKLDDRIFNQKVIVNAKTVIPKACQDKMRVNQYEL